MQPGIVVRQEFHQIESIPQQNFRRKSSYFILEKSFNLGTERWDYY